MNVFVKMPAATLLALLAAGMLQAKPKYVTYEKYGAIGDGAHDDMPAIVAAHNAANEMGVPVKVKSGKTYYIAGGNLSAVIKTDTDFGDARFIIDDIDLENVKAPIFKVQSYQAPYDVKGVSSLSKGQKNIGVSLPCRSLVIPENNAHKVYIRKGLNRNAGTAQTEVIVVDKDGNVQPGSEIIWDYERLSACKAYPVDEKPLVIRGGIFTTIANRWESRYNYHHRGFLIERSNVLVTGLTHLVSDEQDHGAPYTGFLNIQKAVDVTVEDCLMTAHKTYTTIGAAGKPVKMGSYDISVGKSVNTTFRRIRQTTDIDDTAYWGLMASNFCKSITMEDCIVSRFDAHMGVKDVTLRNCTFGHMGTQMVGFGTLTLENCEIHRDRLVLLRSDYGSCWDGEMIIRGCTLKPVRDAKELHIVSGTNNGDHDFGYLCGLPSKIKIENLTVDDSAIKNEAYAGPFIFGSFGLNPNAEGLQPFKAEGVITIDGVTVTSGKQLQLSPNPKVFAGYDIRRVSR